MTAPAVDSM